MISIQQYIEHLCFVLQTVTVKCAPGATTDENGKPGEVTYETMVLDVSQVLSQLMQNSLSHASINEVMVQSGVTTQQVGSRVTAWSEFLNPL